MAITPEHERYRHLVFTVLGNFQFMEEALRVYLAAAYALITEKLDGALPFSYDYTDNDKDALGALISKFEKVNGNVPLIKELRDLVKSRNDVAHRAILVLNDKQHDAEHLTTLSVSLEKLWSRTTPCVERILDEATSVQSKQKRNA